VVTTLAGAPNVTGSLDGTGAAAQFNGPNGLAVDAAGNVYVADSGNFTIRKISPAGVVTTLAGVPGQQGSFDGPKGTANFELPFDVTVDAAGNVYVSDSISNTIRKITPQGMTSTLAGSGGAIGSADGTGPAARFARPEGIAVDASGNVFVVDMFNGTIREVTPAGVTTTLAGTPNSGGFSDGAGAAAQFSGPQGLAIDTGGNLYVTCPSAGTVRRVTPGGVVTTIAGINGDNVNRTGIGPAARFRFPYGVAVDSAGKVYVSDTILEIIEEGFAVAQTQTTVLLGQLTQVYDGSPKTVTVSTLPAGLETIILYGGSDIPPSAVGTYSVFATIADSTYTGSAYGTLTIEPGPSTEPPFTVRHSQPGGSFLWGITAGPPGLVTVGVAGAILSSTDGITWTPRTSGTSNWLVAVTYGGGQYVAVGDNGCVLLSSDGITWLSVAQSATTARLNNVAYAAGVYVAVGEAGSVISSPDGRNWTARKSGLTGWLRGLAYVGGFSYDLGSTLFGASVGSVPSRFVATGQGGMVISSSDGVSWSLMPPSSGNSGSANGQDLEALVATGNTDFIDYGFISDFVAVGSAGTVGIGQWSQMSPLSGLPPPVEDLDPVPIFLPVDFRGLARTGKTLIAAGDQGTIATASITNYYPDVSIWSVIPSGTTADLAGAVAIGDSVFIVGDDETILQTTVSADSRLANLSCRSEVGTGGNGLIAGFAVGGHGASGSLPLLIRASGPALVPFNVPGTIPDPELQLFSTAAASVLLASNTGWGGGTIIANDAAEVGAFAWPDPTSHDSALIETLPVGPYTANISGQSGDTGVALVEIYDATPSGSLGLAAPHLVNLSARAQVGTGGDVLIAGFVVDGTVPKTVLIRASGPALIPFGVPGTLADPKLQVFSTGSKSALVAGDSGWGGDSQIATAAAWVGAFSWGLSATNDSAVLVTLPPGSYTANVSGATGDTGVALVEVYEVE
jgi:sugar lactone lactonase YvrE